MVGTSVLLCAVASMSLLAGAIAADPQRGALREIREWRAQQDRKMRGDRSPFAVERVEMIDKERTTIGRAADSDIRLDAPGVPALAAVVVVRGHDVFIESKNESVLVNGQPFAEHELKPTDRIAIGRYRLQYRRPDGKRALRISNLRGPSMRAYRGLKYFPPNPAYRVPGKFTPTTGRPMYTVDATAGGPQQLPFAGKLEFELDGRALQLDAFLDDDYPDKLFVIFKDKTNGKESYKVGRYLLVNRPTPGSSDVTIDFNQAWNPLCAYGPLFFCPIPPKQNHLDTEIPAGEKTYKQ